MKTLSSSETLAINSIATNKRAKGEKVYNFAAGDPLLINHPKIGKKAIEKIETGICPYPPLDGISELRHMVADWMNRNYLTDYSAQNVIVTCGGKYALFSIIYTFLEPGEEVLMASPYWVSYPQIVKMAGGIPKFIPTEEKQRWKLKAEDLRRHCTKQTKMFLFNNACNPTGILYTKQEVSEILSAAKDCGLLVISDEVYSGLVYEGSEFVSCGSFLEHRESVFVVQSCSKNFAMTGWRVGFILGPLDKLKPISALQSQSTSGVSNVCQWGAIGALENAEEVNFYVKQAMKKRRDLFVSTFHSLFSARIEPIPSAIYAFLSLTSLGISRNINSSKCAEWLINHANIAVVPGTAFGVEGYLRFAFSESEQDVVEGIHVLKEAINRLNSHA